MEINLEKFITSLLNTKVNIPEVNIAKRMIENALNEQGLKYYNGSILERDNEPKFKVGETIIAKDGTSVIKEPFHIDKIEDDYYWDGENTILICNQDEFELAKQKPADKVEPKFKVGDWIVHNTNFGLIYYVESILSPQSDCYCLVHKGGTRLMNFSEEKEYHLWTIQDAKDGDVLAYNDGSLTIFRYRLSGLDAGLYMSHVLLTDKIQFKQTCAINNVHPATKEQRDALMKAMADAGYTFDFEKKELKN